MSDILQITRSRLADGRRIADHDVVRLCDEIDSLRAELTVARRYVWEEAAKIADEIAERGHITFNIGAAIRAAAREGKKQ